MSNEYEPKSAMGWIFAVAGTLVALPIGAINGGINALNGGSFANGVAEVCEPSFEMGAKFGDKHGARVVRGVIVGVITHGFLDLPDIFTDHVDT